MGLFLLMAKLAVASRLRCKVLNHRLGLKSQLTSYIFYQMKNLKNVMLRIFNPLSRQGSFLALSHTFLNRLPL